MLKTWKERKSRLAVLILHVDLFKLSEKKLYNKKILHAIHFQNAIFI